MLEEIKKFIKTHPTFQEIVDYFSSYSKEEIISFLLTLEQNGQIDKLKDKYYLTSELNLIPGVIVSIKERFAFASVGEDEDVYIAINNLKNAFLDDKVLLKKISNNYDEKDEFEVIKVTQRAHKELVGEVKIYGGVKTLDAGKIAANNYLFLIEENKLAVTKHQIIRGLVKKISPKTCIVEPIEILGNKTDVGVDVARIILSNNAPLEFNQDVIEEVKNIPDAVLAEEKNGREDFTSHLICTIDGDDAKDFDDAVEVSKVDDIYYVGVHIADVSHYVKEGSSIDKEALNRATSLYVRDRVVPMLPFELSNGICSLNPNVERLVTSCLFSIDMQGNILTTHICKGVIESKARLTYNYVNKFLKQDRYLKTEYTELEQMLINLEEVSKIIRNKRQKNGGLELSSTELEFKINDDGVPSEVKKRVQDVGEKLIEDLMITANEIVASTIEKKKLPMVFRIHEHPKAKKLESYIRLSNYKGYPCSFDILNCTPLDIAKYLNTIDDENDKEILSSLLLRCLAKAKYSTQNKKHFGLASKSYTHFTSPIRRYPDLMVHRLIERYIVENNTQINDEFKAKLSLECDLCSTRERRALNIERSVESLLCAKYMMNYLGYEFEAKIASMVNQGLFVELDNGIQGFVPFDTIAGDYYIFDEATYRAFGTRKGRVFKLGDLVKVILTNVDLDQAQITFALVTKMKYGKKNKGGKIKNGRKR